MFKNRHVNMRPPQTRGRRGTTLIYTIVLMSFVLLMASLSVDMGRLQLSKTQLQNAADAAARYSVSGMVSSSTPQLTAQSQALAALGQWNVEGGALGTENVTTTVGKWDSTARTFTPGGVNPNAVKIDLVYTYSQGTSWAPLFLNAVSNMEPTLRASSIATATNTQTTLSPPASGNLWLAGMPDGTLNQNLRPDANWVWDYAGNTTTPRQSPLAVNFGGYGIAEGDLMSFEGLSGTASYLPGSADNSADGLSSFLVAVGQTYPTIVPSTSVNGIANAVAPIGAVMAVFLDDDSPTSTSAPSGLDFSSETQRDYSTLSPQMKQVFFVGDGKRSNGEVQRIIVPKGATRVFVGMMDAWQWNDNVGNFQFKMYSRQTVKLVK